MPTQANYTSTGLSAALQHRNNFLVARQSLVAGNLANVNTPDYLAKDLSFKNLVQKRRLSLNVTNDRHIEKKGRPTEYGDMEINKSDVRHDGNSVVYDKEMLKLNDIQLNHRLVTQLYTKHAKMQRLAMGRQ